MSTTPDPDIDYCPFCGLHVSPAGFDAHLDEHDDCTARFDARRGTARDGLLEATGEYRRESSPVRTAVLVVIVSVVLAYSLLVSQQLLLGVLASVVVISVFLLATRL